MIWIKHKCSVLLTHLNDPSKKEICWILSPSPSECHLIWKWGHWSTLSWDEVILEWGGSLIQYVWCPYKKVKTQKNLEKPARGDRGRGDAASGQGPPGPPETGRPSSNASGRAWPCQDLDLRPPASGSAREQISLALSHPAVGLGYGSLGDLNQHRMACFLFFWSGC